MFLGKTTKIENKYLVKIIKIRFKTYGQFELLILINWLGYNELKSCDLLRKLLLTIWKWILKHFDLNYSSNALRPLHGQFCFWSGIEFLRWRAFEKRVQTFLLTPSLLSFNHVKKVPTQLLT